MIKITSSAPPRTEHKDVKIQQVDTLGDMSDYLDMLVDHAIKKHAIPEGVAYTYEFDFDTDAHTYTWVWYETTFGDE